MSKHFEVLSNNILWDKSTSMHGVTLNENENPKRSMIRNGCRETNSRCQYIITLIDWHTPLSQQIAFSYTHEKVSISLKMLFCLRIIKYIHVWQLLKHDRIKCLFLEQPVQNYIIYICNPTNWLSFTNELTNQ